MLTNLEMQSNTRRASMRNSGLVLIERHVQPVWTVQRHCQQSYTSHPQ